MQIILVSSRSNRTRSFNLNRIQLSLLGLGMFGLSAIAAAILQYLSLAYAAKDEDSFLHPVIAAVQAQENQRAQHTLRESLKAMAAKVGDLQARILRLDALGTRLSQVAGLKTQEFMFDRAPGRGGAESSIFAQPVSMTQVGDALDRLASELEERLDKFRILESTLAEEQAKRRFMPTLAPVHTGYSSSGFGWRMDPFTGNHAFHEGLDFSAQEGTPIHAAAGGVVVYAGAHPQYGNMVEIDHGNDLVTRYAHASKLLVKVGDVTLQGSKIAEVGNTGRSTGAHLHFEVRHRGIAQNPARFLRTPG
ncbi:MAG TPA: M23 family metallopeptidase [Burkholderiales bacterium]|nr:M23 family metallopeptidase [Burkholderiales bacterium]